MREKLQKLLRRRRDGKPALEKDIGYRFRRPALLDLALVHRSYRYEKAEASADNQRLEFLGDAVLGLVAAGYVYETFPDRDEGALTTMRSQMTSGQALARVAARIDLGRYLKMGKGEERAGGCNRPSSLADALEAVIGAAYLDGGMRACERIFAALFVPHTARLNEDMWAGNPKGRLQELCQRRWKSSPRYVLTQRNGPAHAQVFTVEVLVNGEVQGRGSGTNKQDAEAEAAGEALRSLAKA